MRIIIDIDGNELRPVSKVSESKPKPIKVKGSEPEADLKLRLLNQDSLEDDEKVKLEGEIVLHVRKLVEKKKKSTAFNMLREIKDMMSPELKDLLSEELKV